MGQSKIPPERPQGVPEEVGRLEELGLTAETLAGAILRAKIRARARQRAQEKSGRPSDKRPKLDTNPDLDAWFER